MTLFKHLGFLAIVTLGLALGLNFPALAGKLTDAVKVRDVALVRSLLVAGGDVQEKVQGDYLLNVAAIFGPIEMVAVLLDTGADIDRPGRDGLHPLHNAVAMGHKDIVALLIQKGANVNSKDRLGRTPLYSFASTGGSDIVIARILLAAGANAKSEEDEYHVTALDNAVETGNLELAELLIGAHADVNHRNIDGWSALHFATHHLRYEFVKVLIAAGADVNLPNKLGKMPLALAPNDAMKQLLIDAGAK